MESNNYSRWRHQMLLVLGKFSLQRHVLDDAADHTFPDWERMDCVVMTWLNGTISPDLEEIVREDHPTARSVWLALEQQFLGNREQRALYLDAAFRNFVQGDLFIIDYCRKLKSMADALGDMGEVVTDRTLVLNLIRGLNECFASIGMHLQHGRPFPTFLEARADLLEELNLAHRSAPSPTTLVASGAAGSTGLPQPPSKPAATPQQPSGGPSSTGSNSRNSGKGDKRGTRGGKGKGRQSSGPAPSANHQQAPPGGPWPSFYKPWSGSISMWPGNRPPLAPIPAPRSPLPAPAPQPQAFVAGAQAQWAAPPGPQGPWAAPPGYYYPTTGMPSWDAQGLASSFNTVSLTPPQQHDWIFDTGATSHMTSDAGTLSYTSSSRYPIPPSIIVGNGALLPVTSSGTAHLPNSLCLNNVLVSPRLIKNLISVRQFTSDNNCSVEFDPSGCSVKDLQSQKVITRCNSSGPLYPLRPSGASPLPAAHLATVAGSSASTLWHRRLGHPGFETLSKLMACNKEIRQSICHACQLGRHIRLPFPVSASRASYNFDLIHCDLWTSPVPSVSGFKYYLVILDDCSHYVWTFPLRLKSDTFTTLSNFFALVSTQFGCTIKSVQCDNGREFDNSSARTFFLTHGTHLRMSCPYTSAQNGKAERTIRSLNNVVRSLLFQACLPPRYWVEALNTATMLLNILPTKTLRSRTPHEALLGSPPAYDHLRVFGCRCYPNLSATAVHKLAPRSTSCVFLGYSAHHKGYRCLDIDSNKIISRHVIFDESSFPFAEQSSPPSPAEFEFLDTFTNPAPVPIGPTRLLLPAAGPSLATPTSPADHSLQYPHCHVRQCPLALFLRPRRLRLLRPHSHVRPRRLPHSHVRLSSPHRALLSPRCIAGVAHLLQRLPHSHVRLSSSNRALLSPRCTAGVALLLRHLHPRRQSPLHPFRRGL
uniref:Integrase catalytic domain-containing protein n=1 Tax=Arundo donax TaxID=35708 RepID=A0A0A9AQB4_ARUDO